MLRTTLLLLASAIAMPCPALAAPPTAVTAMDAYEHVQGLRKEAAEVGNETPSVADLKQAAAKLQEALDYLARPEIRELATGNMYLYARNSDVLRDLAGVYAQMEEKDKALRSLELAQQEAWSPVVAKWLADDARFATLRDEPRYMAVLATMNTARRLWSSPTIATPYRDKLTVEERIAGLSLFWAEARQNFVYFDHVPQLEWDRVYLQFLSQVMAAESTEDYYRVLMQFAHQHLSTGGAKRQVPWPPAVANGTTAGQGLRHRSAQHLAGDAHQDWRRVNRDRRNGSGSLRGGQGRAQRKQLHASGSDAAAVYLRTAARRPDESRDPAAT